MAKTARYDLSLIDPAFAEPGTAAVAQRLVTLVHSDWNADVVFDLDEANTKSMLATHRVSTLIPTRFITSEQRDDYRTRLAAIFGAQLRIEATAIAVITLLDEAGIDHRILKGLASARLDYPSPNLRQTGDVDIAVRINELTACVDLLKQNDYRELPSSTSSNHRTKGTTLVSVNGTEVDIHTRLFRRSPLSDASFARPGVALEGLAGYALPAEERLVHAAGHFLLTPAGMRRMSGLLDMTVLLDTKEVDFDRALSFADELGVAGPVGASLQFESQLTGRQRVHQHLKSWPQPDWLDRSTVLTANRRLVLEHFSRFREVPRAHRLSYLPHWLTPDDHARLVLRKAVDRKKRQLGNRRTRKNRR